MHAIPTSYGGVNFRSRLEARWAAFFDLLGWSWEYEPIDLAGYIPDFILGFERPLLVEVKPVLWTWNSPPDPAVDAVRAKIDHSGWTGPSALLGAQFRSARPSRAILGLARFGPHAPGWQGILGNWTSFGADQWDHQEWFDWSFGYGYAFERPEDKPPAIPKFSGDLEAAWREAGNRVQWKPRA